MTSLKKGLWTLAAVLVLVTIIFGVVAWLAGEYLL